MQEQQTKLQETALEILAQMRKVIVGKDETLMWVLAAILAKGHLLLEDIPGVGKTTMAVAFSKVLDLSYNRVQFTPDVLPSDVTGYSVLDSATGQMRYQPGAVLCNLFLADELNRATSRTQSALLEAMEEGQVTVDGVTHIIPQPFVVIATQNPTGAAGTQMLPDSQMDRFAVRLSLGYPAAKEELTMVMNRQKSNPLKELTPLVTKEQLGRMQEEVASTYIGEAVVQYAVDLIHLTRKLDCIQQGASPRATLMLVSMAKALAQLRGRDYVIPQDVQDAFPQTVAHRLILSPQAEGRGITAQQILSNIIQQVKAPVIG
ncbi:MAG: MoxR family ATPase [Ruminococcaceae bacterium]|nr:MoxR family ATPase [Oscillospiraceae bacterium]